MQAYLRRISRFEIVAFTTGFALMTFELVAARLLAPRIGSSVYVWTSVIGVIVAALSIGYAVGGKLADARVRTTDVAWLLLLAAYSVLAASLLAPSFLEVIAATFVDARVQGVVASVVLFAPLSFLLGVVSPYLVRLRVSSAKTSGESVALLSALNSIGGITGTFLTGFIFFGFFGTVQALVIVALLLLASSWLLEPKTRWPRRLAFSVFVVIVGIMSLFPVQRPDLMASIDTPSATYQVYKGHIVDQSAVRVLVTGPSGYQSGVYDNGRPDLVFFYTQKIAQVVAQAPKKQHILLLGGGAFTLPQYLATKYPQAQIDVVEIDPQLEPIAKKYFYYKAPHNVRVIAEDARTFLNKNKQQYDIAITDVYSDSTIPFSLTTKEFSVQLKRALQPDGVVVANFIIGTNTVCAPLAKGLNAAYSLVRPNTVFFPRADETLWSRQNVVAVYGSDDMKWLARKGAASAQIAPATPFTDNFAPIELLNQRCRETS